MTGHVRRLIAPPDGRVINFRRTAIFWCSPAERRRVEAAMGYGSNSNIYMINSQPDSSGRNEALVGVAVSIYITEALQCAMSANQTSAQNPAMCSFQLNAWSQLTSSGGLPNVVWQQYIFTITRNSGSGYTIGSMVNN
jgi:hypothetical protein